MKVMNYGIKLMVDFGEKWCYSMEPPDYDGFILCGEKYVPKEIPWLFKIDADDNMIWEKNL
jgi:hypothetical protein